MVLASTACYTLPPDRTQPQKLNTANFSSGTFKTLINNRAKMPLNLTSEGQKYPPEVRIQHETCSTICETHVQVILNQKNLTGIGRGGQGRSKQVKILLRMGLAFGLGAF